MILSRVKGKSVYENELSPKHIHARNCVGQGWEGGAAESQGPRV